MTLKIRELKVGDTVGISPGGMRDIFLYDTAVVENISKTQIRVRVIKKPDTTVNFLLSSGNQVGGDRWHPRHLASLEEANLHNTTHKARIKRKRTLAHLRNLARSAGTDTYTQEQLDAAVAALTEGDV